jgi:hypothetical protein
MIKGVVPHPDIDMYARWDQSVSQSYQAVGQLVINSTQQQILVLRLTYKIVNALAIKSQLPQGVLYTAADCGYDDDHKLYDLSITRGFELLRSVS